MNAREFYNAVVMMRQAQREREETRTEEAKVKAERLEAMIDHEIHRVEVVLRMREAMPALGLHPVKERR